MSVDVQLRHYEMQQQQFQHLYQEWEREFQLWEEQPPATPPSCNPEGGISLQHPPPRTREAAWDKHRPSKWPGLGRHCWLT